MRSARRALRPWCVGGTVSNVDGGRGECSCGRDYVRVTAAGNAYRHKVGALTRAEVIDLRRLMAASEERAAQGGANVNGKGCDMIENGGAEARRQALTGTTFTARMIARASSGDIPVNTLRDMAWAAVWHTSNGPRVVGTFRDRGAAERAAAASGVAFEVVELHPAAGSEERGEFVGPMRGHPSDDEFLGDDERGPEGFERFTVVGADGRRLRSWWTTEDNARAWSADEVGAVALIGKGARVVLDAGAFERADAAAARAFDEAWNVAGERDPRALRATVRAVRALILGNA